MKLAGGVGLSVINHLPEEILYVNMSGLSCDITKAGNKTTLMFDLMGFQVGS